MEYEESYVNFPCHNVHDFSRGCPHQNDKITASAPCTVTKFEIQQNPYLPGKIQNEPNQLKNEHAQNVYCIPDVPDSSSLVTSLFSKEYSAVQKAYPWTKIMVITLSIVCLLLLAIIVVILIFYLQMSEQRSKETEEMINLKANITEKTAMYNDILTKCNGTLNDYSIISARSKSGENKASEELKEIKAKLRSVLKNFSVVKEAVCIQPVQGNLCELCPFNWTSFRRSDRTGAKASCYFISTAKKNWDESRMTCKEMDADLVVINTREEKDFITSLTKGDMLWIGLTDRKREGTFQWVDGTHLTQPLIFWRSGEPNNLYPNDPNGEDCVTEEGDWNDASCARPFKWICEQEAKQILMDT